MSVEFSQIPDRLNYPKHIKGELSSYHSYIITYVSGIYDGSHELRSKTIRLINTVTYHLMSGDSFPKLWDPKTNPFTNIEIEDEFWLKERLGKLYVNPKEVNWDIPVVRHDTSSKNSTQDSEPIVPKSVEHKTEFNTVRTSIQTDKSDLYIQPPTVPQFDVNKPWMSAVIDGDIYCIYTSIPEVPTKQNEISVTTNVDSLSEAQLLRLYPNNFIRTRSPVMYQYQPGLRLHNQLGILLPIDGFTEDEILDNIVRYPHLYKLSKVKDDDVISFYNTIEIDGVLHKVSDIWKELPDTAKIPYNADFVKEYVVRRYLLERDVRGIHHKYPMYGTLDPFLTLFMSTSDYINLGYTNIVDIAKMCVKSRVSYKRSRNPIIRRCENV